MSNEIAKHLAPWKRELSQDKTCFKRVTQTFLEAEALKSHAGVMKLQRESSSMKYVYKLCIYKLHNGYSICLNYAQVSTSKLMVRAPW